VLTRQLLRPVLTHLLIGGFVLLVPSLAWADAGKIKALLVRAELHEKSYEWDKAFAVYDAILKVDRDRPGVKDRQAEVLRRYWQEQRHKDIGYRKEVLSLDYSQALRLNSVVFDTLIENSLPKSKLSAGLLLKKGIEELEAALRDPGFVAVYLAQSRPVALASFREFLARKKTETANLTRADCMKALREVALAGQAALELSPTVALMELACGACYAIDEYTAYLTPAQYRELTDSLKATPMAFVPSVHIGLKSADIGYVQISHFQESTPQELDEAFAILAKAGMKGMILDLRGNPGGLVDSAIDVARRFLSSGVIASTENYDPRLSTVYHARNAAAWTAPLVVLVDADTASAAEVLAGALKDNGRARVLGQPTFGKGSSQALVKLPEAIGGLPTGGLRLTIARFFSPKGLPYAGQGVTPDVLLQPSKPDSMNAPDPQIIAAQDELQRLLAANR
jgi:hypothetical protein